MIETIILNYLKTVLDVAVYMEVPMKEPESYVVIEKTGGGQKNKVENSIVIIQSYAKDLLGAAKLNDQVKQLMLTASINEVGGIEMNSDYNFTDLSKKKYRYQAVFNITHY